jgi:sec-independent protein translocase protein TatB
MFGLGMGELIVIFFIILLLFGAKNLPEMAKSMGKAVRDFRNAANEIKSGLEVDIERADSVKKAEGDAKKDLPSPVAQAPGKVA